MLKRIAIAIALVTALCAQSQPQQHPVLNPSANNQQQPQTDQRGTDKSPLIIQLKNTPKTQSEADQDADYQQRRAADYRSFKVGIAGIIVSALQTVALFFTFVIIAFVAVRELRAYVYCEITGLRRFNLTEPIQINANWKNCGKTPAKYVEMHGSVFFAKLPLPDGIDFEPGPIKEDETGRHGKPAMFPGTFTSAFYESVDHPITPEIAEAFKARKIAIYVAGEAFYRDIFRRKRKTRFCQYIAPDDLDLLIEAEHTNAELKDFEVRFVMSHIFNDFT